MKQTVTERNQDFHKARRADSAAKLLCCIYCLLAILFLPQSCLAFDHSHKLFSNDLRKYVRMDGVLYDKWKANHDDLDKYLNSLSELSADEYEKFGNSERKALWLNAYNALAVKLVLEHYPIKGQDRGYPSNSIRQISNTWEAFPWKVAGKTVTLYSIAHDILRRDMDCRMHFAIVPASIGGGALQKEAFEAGSVDEDLNRVTREYMSRPENLQANFSEFSITVSRVFKWFPLDFLNCIGDGRIPIPPPKDDDIVRAYVQNFLPAEIRERLKGKEMKIIYGPYDWSLNDAGAE